VPTYLFTVDGYDEVKHGLALLPGIPASSWELPAISAIRQDTEVELRLPGGMRHLTRIETYCMRVPLDNSSQPTGKDVRALIVLSKNFNKEKIPLGTEVWLPDGASVS